CGSQQPSTNGPTATREGPKTKSTDRFYASTAPPAADEVYPQPPQIGCYSSSEGTGFLEGIFNATTPEGALVSTAYESHSQYGFDPVTGHFVAPVSFFPHPNQGELLTPHPIASADPQSVGAGLNVKHHHQPQLHEQPRTLEETASISSNSSVTGAGAITTCAYFWQYNAQCKGPKAVRLISGGTNSPLSSATSPLSSCYDGGGGGTSMANVGNCSIAVHSLPQYPLVVFEDPVQKRNDLVHCSKLRRGDGNDVTPNIMRLRSMGDELDRLAAQITRQGEIIMAGGGGGGGAGGGGTEMPGVVRSAPFDLETVGPPPSWRVEEAKREKNKLASKICRLKKKAFHESNKIKYTGLGLEYKELANLITSLKKMIAQHASPSLARLLQQSQQSGEKIAGGSGGGDGEKLAGSADGGQAESLFARAKWLASATHVTLVAGRMDAFVEEVLNLAKSTQAKHPLIKRLSSGCSSTSISSGTREIPVPAAPKFPSITNPLTQMSTEVPDPSFTYAPANTYDYSQRAGFPAALDLSNMVRSSTDRFVDYHSHYEENRQADWFEYGSGVPYQTAEDAAYTPATYIAAYHPQGAVSSQDFVYCGQQFYDALGPQVGSEYQSLQQGSVKVAIEELGTLPASTDVPSADSGISVNCPQRLSVIT
ncbi:unnamed protein product, partial [Mesocestoides corti]